MESHLLEARLAQMETKSNKVIQAKLVFRLVLRKLCISFFLCHYEMLWFDPERDGNYDFYNSYTPPSRVNFRSANNPLEQLSTVAMHINIDDYKLLSLIRQFVQSFVEEVFSTRTEYQQDMHTRNKFSHPRKTSIPEYLFLCFELRINCWTFIC